MRAESNVFETNIYAVFLKINWLILDLEQVVGSHGMWEINGLKGSKMHWRKSRYLQLFCQWIMWSHLLLLKFLESCLFESWSLPFWYCVTFYQEKYRELSLKVVAGEGSIWGKLKVGKMLNVLLLNFWVNACFVVEGRVCHLLLSFLIRSNF